MMDEYKQKIFDYITGDYEIEQPGINEPLILNESSNETNVYEFIKDYLAKTYGGSWTGAIYRVFNSFNIDGNGNQYIGLLFRGFKIGTTEEEKSCICICDGNFIPLKVLSKFKNGTDFRIITDLKVAEDGTLYGIDYLEGGTSRFIMLNNIFLALNDNYYADLRYSLNIPSSAYYIVKPTTIKKCYNESSYILSYDDGGVANKLYATYLKVEATESPEWRKFETAGTLPDDILVSDISIKKNGDNFDVLLSATGYDDENIVEVYSCSTSQTGNTLYRDRINIVTPYSRQMIFDVDCVVIKELDNSFYCIGVNYQEKTAYIIKIIGSHSSYSYSIIGSAIAPERFNNNINIDIGILENENEIFYGIDFSQENIDGEHIIGRVYYNDLCSNQKTQNFSIPSIVTKQYNLYKYYKLDYDKINIFSQIWNDNNYNGLPYQDFDSLTPKTAYFNDSQNTQFARNLINNTYFNNEIVSSVLIPNLYINNINIIQNNLMGITNNKIIENNTSWQKNIYENVYINFVQRYRVINKNVNPNIIQNIEDGLATKDIVTKLQSPQISYNQIKLTKYRLNFADNTSKTIYLDIVNKNNRLIKYIFLFYVEKELTSIDLISEDENTIYLTIENDDRFEINKYYSLTQEMTIE